MKQNNIRQCIESEYKYFIKCYAGILSINGIKEDYKREIKGKLEQTRRSLEQLKNLKDDNLRYCKRYSF